MKRNDNLYSIVYRLCCTSKIIKIMKINTFLLLVTVLHSFAGEIYSQNTKLTIGLGETTVEQVLKEIESQSEFYFLFNQELVETNRKINLQISDEKIEDILDRVFEGTDVEYIVLDRQIVLSTGEYLAEIKSKLQPRTISGTVKDENGVPLVGLTVTVKGTTTGTITDADGNFMLQIPSDAETLVFSYVGYQSKEITIGNLSVIDITMMADITDLEEVVVIGYGVQKKKLNTGATVNLKGDDLQKLNTATPMDALKGISAGVSIIQNNGMPGSGTKVLIRGAGTIDNAKPLFIVDDFSRRY